MIFINFTDREKLILDLNNIKLKVPDSFSKDFVIKFFNNLDLQKSYNLNPEFVNIIICDINKNDVNFYNRDISDRLKYLVVKNLNLYDIKIYNIFINLFNQNNNLQTYNDIKLKTEISKILSKTKIDVINNDVISNLFNDLPTINKFYKIESKIIECIEKNINLINKIFIEKKKETFSDLKNMIYSLKNEYNSVLNKISPLFKINDLSELSEGKNYKLYSFIQRKDGVPLFYNLVEKKLIQLEFSYRNFIIDYNYNLYEYKDDLTAYKIINKNVSFYQGVFNSNLEPGNYLKYIYLVKKKLDDISKGLDYLYLESVKNSKLESIKDYLESMYIWAGYLRPKKQFMILNVLIYMGGIDSMYNWFGSKLFEREEKKKMLNEYINLKKSEIEKNEEKMRLFLSIPKIKISNNEYLENKNKLYELLYNKFNEFINLNIKNENKLINFVYLLNNIIYENIEQKDIDIIENKKNILLELLNQSQLEIWNNLEENTSDKIFKYYWSYNKLNLFDIGNLLMEKINDLPKPGSSLTNIEYEINRINVLLNNSLLSKYNLLLEILKLQIKILNTKELINNNNTYNYLLDIFTAKRLKYGFSIPFNENVLSSNIALKKWHRNVSLEEEAYHDLLLKTGYRTFAYGSYGRNERADCGETMILNLMNYLIYNPLTQKLEAEWLPENILPEIKLFYKKNSSLDLINSDDRKELNKLFYDREFTMQTVDFYTNNFKVYKNFNPIISTDVLNSDIWDLEIVKNKKIYDIQGKLIAGEREIKYTGYEIRTNYIAYIRLINIIFGFNKISNKYNENFVMNNITIDSLKEILLTFKNPKISDILSNYSFVSLDSQINTPFNPVSQIELGELVLNLKNGHAFIDYQGVSSDRSSRTSEKMDLLKVINIEYKNFIKYTYLTKIKLEYNLLPKKEQLEKKEEINLLNPQLRLLYLINSKNYKYFFKTNSLVELFLINQDLFVNYISKFINYLFKNYSDIREDYFVVFKYFNLPSFKFTIYTIPNINYVLKNPIHLNKIFNKYKCYMELELIKLKIDNSIKNKQIKYLIQLVKNDDVKKNNLLLYFMKNGLIDYFIKYSNLFNVNPFINQLGSNILHFICYNSNYKNFNAMLVYLKSFIIDEVWNYLLLLCNYKKEIPLLTFYNKKREVNDLLLPIGDSILYYVCIYILLKENYNLSKIKSILDSSDTLKLKVYMFIIKNKIKMFDDIDNYIDFVQYKIPEEEYIYIVKVNNEIKNINLNVLKPNYKPLVYSDINSGYTIDQINYDIVSKYDFSVWNLINLDLLYDLIKTHPDDDIYIFIKILQERNLLKLLPNIGFVYYMPSNLQRYLHSHLYNYSQNEEILNIIFNNLDSNGNNFFHSIAFLSRIIIKNTDALEYTFEDIYDEDKITFGKIMKARNNNGWTVFDIFSYIPYYKNSIYENQYQYIRDLIHLILFLLRRIITISDEEEKKNLLIFITQYDIFKYYGFIDKTHELFNYLEIFMYNRFSNNVYKKLNSKNYKYEFYFNLKNFINKDPHSGLIVRLQTSWTTILGTNTYKYPYNIFDFAYFLKLDEINELEKPLNLNEFNLYILSNFVKNYKDCLKYDSDTLLPYNKLINSTYTPTSISNKYFK